MGQKTTLVLFRREGMAEVVGTSDLPTEAVCKDRVAWIVEVEEVDGVFETLGDQGVEFVVKPEDMVQVMFKNPHPTFQLGHSGVGHTINKAVLESEV